MLFSQFFLIAIILAFSPIHSSSCPENEIEMDCVNPCNTCEQKGRCDHQPPCRRGCDCKFGFYRDEKGFCVSERQCSGKAENLECPRNAMFVPCSPLSLPTCENPFLDPDYDEECIPGCACRPGFLKQKDGQCVTPDQCYSKEDHGKEPSGMCQEDEEYYECTPSCKNTCENFNNPGVKCQCGAPGCFCREGLVKRADGKCIPLESCARLPSPEDPAPKCPKNAVFIKCGSPCPPTCDDLQPEPCEEKCTTACYCKPGYLKRKDGVCVRPIDCHPRKKQERRTPKCPENAIFIECGSPCPPTCEDRLPEPCEEKCTKACYCKPGFLLKADEGKCVKPEQCNASPEDARRCPENEEPSDCVKPCNDCKVRGKCKFLACNKGCDCKKGHFRNDNGKCIPASECPEIIPHHKCAADEQFYECTPNCKNTCESLNNPDAKCQCGPPGCFCKEGLLKREDGKCVNPDQCRKNVRPDRSRPECASDEQFYECKPSCKNTCSHFQNPGVQCRCGPPGCFCKEGLVKRSDGNCVPPSQCPVSPRHACGANETFYNCTPSCKNTCENFSNPAVRCACGPPGCFCKKGLVKRADGKCVPSNQCRDVTVPDDCHGCPNTAECEAYCKSLGDFVGLCTGKDRRHCRCTSLPTTSSSYLSTLNV